MSDLRSSALFLFLVFFGALNHTALSATPAADTVYLDGRVYTVNPEKPWAEAVAVRDGKFVAVGSTVEVKPFIGNGTRKIDLQGAFVMPGIVDAHIHPFVVYLDDESGGLMFSDQLDADAIADTVRSYAAANPEKRWITGGQYGFGAFPEGKMTREWLDVLVPDRPAYLLDESGHNATANSVALKLAGISAATPDPPLGIIDKDPTTGEPTGYLSETAIGLVGRLSPRSNEDDYRRAMERSFDAMSAWGITSFIDMLATRESIDVYFELAEQGRLPFRVITTIAMNEYSDELITPDEAGRLLPEMKSRATEQVDTSHFKFWADGTPLTYTALLLDKYSDRDSHGMLTMTDEMGQDAISYLGQGYGGHMHALGDGTARYVLDLVEEARKRYPGKVRRFHLAHSSLVHPDDYKRIVAMDVVAEVGPALWYPSPVKTLLEAKVSDSTAARWFDIRSMLDAGITIAWGSDWPAGTPDANPFRGLEGLVTRAHPWGESEGTWGTPISLEEGISILTMGGAYAMERESEIGSIETGKSADFIVLDRNLFETRPENLDQTKVVRTVFSGTSVFVR